MTNIIVKSRDSLLTTSSGYTNYRGILNLVIILLVLSNARVALENVIKYGILVDPLSWVLFFVEGSKHWPALQIVLSLGLHVLVSFLAEKFIATQLAERLKQVGAEELIDAHQQRQQSNRSTNDSPSNHPPDHPHHNDHHRHHHQKQHQHQDQQTTNKTPLRHLSRTPNGSPAAKISSTGEQVACEQQVAARWPGAGSSAPLVLTNAIIISNLFACLSLPPFVIYSNDTHPISTSVTLMLVSIVFLKLVSYHMINFWCRDVKLSAGHESLFARTTKSFLMSYTPPIVEFGPRLGPPKRQVALDESRSQASEPSAAEASPTKQQQVPPAGAPQAPASEPSRSEAKTAAASSTTTSSSPGRLAQLEARRVARLAALRTLSRYPANVHLRDVCEFMLFPTLCYEVQFARTERPRKRFLIKRTIELLVLSQLDLALIQQWIVPTVSNSVLPFRQMQFSHMLERLLKLAIPNHVIWLIWFYLFFHSLLNIIAELTRFADREFYRDWWNSESVYYFWSNWNIPVHKWCARHLYVPLISLGFNKCQASTAVFFVSAFFHEYLVSVPLKLFRMWAFTGMLIQLPWARFVSAYFNSHFANVAVWVSLIIGQPLCILMYYHDYYVTAANK